MQALRFLSAAAALGLALLASAPARADAEGVRVTYSAPAGCSSRAAFVREVSLRTSRIRVIADSQPGASFVVELADRTTAIAGQLRWIERDGSETVRAVSGATCEEVVSALALIAAVLVDPESLSRRPISPPPIATLPVAPPREPESLRLRPSMAAGAIVSSTVAPSWSYGAHFELALELESGGRHGPLASVSVARLSGPTASTLAGDADFTTTFGRLALCPLAWPATGAWLGRACGAFEAGSLHAAGSRTIDKREVSILWLAADPLVSVVYRPLPVLGIEVELGGVFPLVNDDFFFGPDIPVFSIPVAGFSARLALRALWP